MHSTVNIAICALLLNACASPKDDGVFDPNGADHAGSGGQADGAASGAGTAGSTGAVAGTGASAGGGAANAAGGAMSAGSGGAGAGGASVGGAGGATAGSAAGLGLAGGGGVAGGGASGTGGTLSKCDFMALQLGSALVIAQTCNPTEQHPYCTGYVKNECGCQVPVDEADSLATQNYLKLRDTLMADCKPACATACTEPKSQTCRISWGIVVGLCVATPK